LEGKAPAFFFGLELTQQGTQGTGFGLWAS